MRHIYAVTLTLLAAVWSGVLTAHATGEPPSGQRTGSPFLDVAPDDWFYENVQALYELGIAEGVDETHFAPDSELTLGQTAAMAARLRSLYETGNSEAGAGRYIDPNQPSTAWYAPYVAYLRECGVVADEFDDTAYQRSATRAEMAHILAGTLPEEVLATRNDQEVTVGYASRNYITDVTEYTAYQPDILNLYRWGILEGVDETGSYAPEQPITRGEAAAMLTRLAYEDLRLTLDWNAGRAYSKAGVTLSGLVPEGIFHVAPAPDDSVAVDETLRYMLSRGENTLALSYPEGLNSVKVDAIMAAFQKGLYQYIEQGYTSIRSSYTGRGNITLKFSSHLCEEGQLDAYREGALSAAVSVHDTLWETGVIQPAMNEYARAKAYFLWLCEHCEYDYTSSWGSMSHSGYQALTQGVAVCDGYTSAYNLLLKLEGIECTTAATGEHIWTVARLDGVYYHIDPTWGDQDWGVSEKYFGMSEEDAWSRFA